MVRSIQDPWGAVLTPSLAGVEAGGQLPNASTFCGRCEAVCPMRIPLPKMMRHWREREFEKNLNPATQRWGLKFWAYFAKRPKLYGFFASLGIPMLSLIARKGFVKSLPLAGGWTRFRDLPAPQLNTFQQQWKRRQSGSSGENS